MRLIRLAMAALAAVLCVALAVGSPTPVLAAPLAAAPGDPYAPKIPTKCKVKLVGKKKISQKKYRPGMLKVRFAVKENSPREMRTPVVFILKKGKRVVDKDRARYAGDPQKYRIHKVKKGKYRLKARTKDGANSRFEDCKTRIKFRVVRR